VIKNPPKTVNKELTLDQSKDSQHNQNFLLQIQSSLVHYIRDRQSLLEKICSQQDSLQFPKL